VRLLIVFFFSLALGSAIGQTTSLDWEKKFIDKDKKYQLHLDFQIFSGRTSTLGLILKKSYGLEDFENNYYFTNLRLVTRYNYHFEFNDAPHFDAYRSDSFGTASHSGIGVERQHMRGRFGFHYGLDLIFTREIRIPDFSLNANQGARLRLDRRHHGVGLNPFVGIIYYLSSNVSMAAETGYFFRFINKRNRELEVFYNSGWGTTDIVIHTLDVWIDNVFQHSFNNLRFFTLNLHF
jgi:hypothetical protein